MNRAKQYILATLVTASIAAPAAAKPPQFPHPINAAPYIAGRTAAQHAKYRQEHCMQNPEQCISYAEATQFNATLPDKERVVPAVPCNTAASCLEAAAAGVATLPPGTERDTLTQRLESARAAEQKSQQEHTPYDLAFGIGMAGLLLGTIAVNAYRAMKK